jgi:hypothetical protein
MKHVIRALVVVSALLMMAGGPYLAVAQERIKADLEGFQEVPAVSTTGSGEFRGKISNDEAAIEFRLSYEGLQGTVTQAHIHLGQRGVNGGISLFLCSNLPSPPAGTPGCPVPSGTVTGTLTATDVIGPAGQGISPGEFAEVLRAIRDGVTYANVHSTMFPGGEIRGQIRR